MDRPGSTLRRLRRSPKAPKGRRPPIIRFLLVKKKKKKKRPIFFFNQEMARKKNKMPNYNTQTILSRKINKLHGKPISHGSYNINTILQKQKVISLCRLYNSHIEKPIIICLETQRF
jgi:hypothetical protein